VNGLQPAQARARKHLARLNSVARDRHRAAWEDWGRIDPFWAILTEADARHGRWDVDRFFATGVEQVAAMLAHTQRYGRPSRRGTALDFGCGLGRLTRALAPHFETTYGLDVASTMIERAQQLDTELGRSGAAFVRHDDEDLSRFASGSVDLLSCLLVLQHLPSRDAIEGYLGEFVRVLSSGGVAVVQLPVRVPKVEGDPHGPRRMRGRRLLRAIGVRPRFRWRSARAVGVSPKFLYERLGWEPEMLMSGIPYEETVTIFEAAGGRLLDATRESRHPGGVVSRTYLVAPRDDALARL
jgi:SAM-dependent methyltransferase